MLRADSAAEISGKFIHSYIRTRHTSALRAPGRIRYAYRLGAETRRVRSWTSILPPRSGVRMYESRPFILSQTLDAATGNKNFRTFVRSYADC
jgi:hypothetical protein